MMFNLQYYLDFEYLFKFRYEDILWMLNRDDEPEFTKFLDICVTFWLQLLPITELNFFAFWRADKYFYLYFYLYFKWHSIHKIELTDTLNKYFLAFSHTLISWLLSDILYKWESWVARYINNCQFQKQHQHGVPTHIWTAWQVASWVQYILCTQGQEGEQGTLKTLLIKLIQSND